MSQFPIPKPLNMHPLAVAARTDAEIKKRDKEAARQMMALTVAGFESTGIKFLHVGSCTVAYKEGNGSMVEISVAYRSPKDPHDKVLGAHTAGLLFGAGKTIRIRKVKGVKVPAVLRALFSYEQAFKGLDY